ncbi:hypothetical protein ZIOFF_026039 [Zingiber officinale]|uniref:Wall-associated receptor kinase galacturonan-binding domain-containing protein n=1 Tax=Zingiber officinale TaxID=94328 RepID=A0A8J5L771_ZINOF|nr:hypothetical protein ZIOFF_026039 [Zingiber officinale]
MMVGFSARAQDNTGGVTRVLARRTRAQRAVICGGSDPGGRGRYSKAHERRCGDVDIPFPFGIESDCFLPGFHVFCNHSKLYSAGNIQILNFSLVEPRATIIQKNAHVHPQKYNNSTGGVYISREMDLTGSPFFFSIRDNIFAAAGCNVVAFFSSSNTLFNTPNGRA